MKLLRVSLLSVAVVWSAGFAAQQGDLDEVRGLMEAGRLDEAVQSVDAFLATRPGDADARFLKGLILVQQERTEEAIEVFTKMTEDYPQLPEPYNNLAVLYAAADDYEKAREALLVAIRTHPSYATAHENLGDLYAKMAAVAYDRALVLDQKNRAAKAKLALVNELFSVDGGGAMLPARSEGTTQAKPTQTASSAVESTAQAAGKTKPVTRVAAKQPAKAQRAPSSGTGPDPKAEVLAALKNWAAAWSAQDVEGYLAHYGEEFRPPKKLSRTRWEAQRRVRLKKPSYIDVTVIDPKVRMDSDDRARLTFVQRYQSSTYGDRVRKSLVMRREAGGWKIVSEQVLR